MTEETVLSALVTIAETFRDMDVVAPIDPERRNSRRRVVGANSVRLWRAELRRSLNVLGAELGTASAEETRNVARVLANMGRP